MKRDCSRAEGVLLLCVFFLVLNVFCLNEQETSSSLMEETEKQALYSAVQGFVGKWWNGSQLYPDPCGWTPIQGVSCDLFDGFWYVTVLNIGLIHDNSIPCTPNAEFRRHLFEFKHLKTLSFTNCFIYPQQSISIPTNDWDKLGRSLESLEFRSNPALSGLIPSSFCNLTNLHSLVLLENRLSGALPVNIGNLLSLRRIVLARNMLSGRIPSSLGGLSQLLIFDSSSNFLTGQVPQSFGGLISLLKLDLSNNILNGRLPSELGNLKNLTLLDLRNNTLSGGLTKSLQEMASLEQMVLSNNPIGGDLAVIEWQNLQNMVSLDLSSMGLTGNIPESLTMLRRLRFLGLEQNKLSGTISPKLAALPSLSALYMNGNNLTGKLEFSEWFYGKMGRRFGAWSNPNLCFPEELVSTGHVPFGVKPCQKEVTLLEENSNIKLSHENSNHKYSLMVSLGHSTVIHDGTWWILFLGEMVFVVVFSCNL